MERMKISPYARRTAKELGVDVSVLAGTGPHGRIVWRDVDAASHKPATHTQASTPAAQAPHTAGQKAAPAAHK